MTVVSGGFVGAAHPEGLTAAIERRFLSDGHPGDLNLVFAAGQGDGTRRAASIIWGMRGWVKRVIGGHWGLLPRLGRLAIDNQIEAYCFPQGVICQLLRDIAAGRPGCLTHVGLGTFIDPIHRGGRNERGVARLADRAGRTRGPDLAAVQGDSIQIGLIRASAADPFGNLVMDEEAVLGEVLPIAQAVHKQRRPGPRSGEAFARCPRAPSRVRVPGVLVDRIVVAQDHEHDLTFGEASNSSYYTPLIGGETHPVPSPMPLDERRIIAARACEELVPGAIANLGIGMRRGSPGSLPSAGCCTRSH